MKREQPDYPEVEVHLEAPHRVRPFPHVYALPTPMCRHPEGGLYPDLSRVDDLVVELRNLAARNLSPDVVFKERDVLLTVRAYDYDFTRRGGHTGTSLTLLKVGVLL